MKITLITVFTFCTLFVFGQSRMDLPPSNPGECHAKCLMSDEWATSEIELKVYTGDENDMTVKREIKEVVLKEGRKGWEKRVADRNCLSPNPNDCLVWCLVDIPEEKINRLVVVGDAPDSTFTIETFEVKELVKKGGFTEWKQVVCANKITNSLIREVQSGLVDADLLNEKYLKKKRAKFNNATKAALKEYQQKHGLPIGNLDFETLAHLGVNY